MPAVEFRHVVLALLAFEALLWITDPAHELCLCASAQAGVRELLGPESAMFKAGAERTCVAFAKYRTF